MSFPIFSRPGKLVTKVRDLPRVTLSGTRSPVYGLPASTSTERYRGWETITAARNGPLDLKRYTIRVRSGHWVTNNSGGYVSSDTRILPYREGTILGPQSRFAPLELISHGYNLTHNETLLASQGAEGMSRAWPTNPTADTAVFLGELKDGLPSFIGSNLKRKGFKGASGEWLNFQFAISPLISDVSSFKKAYEEGPARLQQLRRDAGRAVRRKRVIEKREEVLPTTSSVSPVGFLVRSPTIYQMVGLPSRVPLDTVVRRSEDVWFCGNFYYHLPSRLESPAFNDMLDSLQYNWGLVPDISTAWELTPYSWAVDYFTNIGDVLRNLSRLSQGNQFADAFVMRHTRESYTASTPFQDLFTEQIVERKYRRRTSPFALGASADLTAKQWANLLAVGWERHLSR